MRIIAKLDFITRIDPENDALKIVEPDGPAFFMLDRCGLSSRYPM